MGRFVFVLLIYELIIVKISLAYLRVQSLTSEIDSKAIATFQSGHKKYFGDKKISCYFSFGGKEKVFGHLDILHAL